MSIEYSHCPTRGRATKDIKRWPGWCCRASCNLEGTCISNASDPAPRPASAKCLNNLIQYLSFQIQCLPKISTAIVHRLCGVNSFHTFKRDSVHRQDFRQLSAMSTAARNFLLRTASRNLRQRAPLCTSGLRITATGPAKTLGPVFRQKSAFSTTMAPKSDAVA